jgi:predicted ATPase
MNLRLSAAFSLSHHLQHFLWSRQTLKEVSRAQIIKIEVFHHTFFVKDVKTNSMIDFDEYFFYISTARDTSRMVIVAEVLTLLLFTSRRVEKCDF